MPSLKCKLNRDSDHDDRFNSLVGFPGIWRGQAPIDILDFRLLLILVIIPEAHSNCVLALGVWPGPGFLPASSSHASEYAAVLVHYLYQYSKLCSNRSGSQRRTRT